MQTTAQLSVLHTISYFDPLLFQKYEKAARAIYRAAFAEEPWLEFVSADTMDGVFVQALKTDSVFMGAFDGESLCNALLIGFPIETSSVSDIVDAKIARAAVYLSDICTSPHQQGQGIGRLLLGRFEKHCIAAGYRRVVLRTHADCEWLCDFYVSAGYEKLLDFNFPIVREVDGVETDVDCIRTVFTKSLEVPVHHRRHQ